MWRRDVIMDNHFSQAYKYVETENSSQLENYATEILVLVLCYLKSDENKFSDVNNKIAKLLGFNSSDYKNIKFETQKSHSDFERKIKEVERLIPDVSIYLNNKLHTIIEAKIDQGLNQYTIEDERKINQLEAYASIDGVQKVILLSKYNEQIDEKYKSIKWNQIYQILVPLKDDFIVKNFLNFLDEFYIGKNVKFEDNGKDILSFIGNFLALLRNAWDKAKFERFSLSKTVYANECGLGFYIRNKEGLHKSEYFLGINHYEGYRDKIAFWSEKKIKANEKFTKVIDGGFITTSNKTLSELSNKDFDEQIKDLSDWITTNIKPILENKQQEGEK